MGRRGRRKTMRRRRQQRKGSFHGNTVRSHNLTPGWLPQPLCRRQECMPSSGWSQDHPELGPGPPRGPGGFALHRHQMKMDVHPFLSSYHGAPVTQMPSNAFFCQPQNKLVCNNQRLRVLGAGACLWCYCHFNRVGRLQHWRVCYHP